MRTPPFITPEHSPRDTMDEARANLRCSTSDSELSESTLESEWTESSRAPPNRSNGHNTSLYQYALKSPEAASKQGGIRAHQLPSPDSYVPGPASEFSWVHRMGSSNIHNNALLDAVDEWGNESSSSPSCTPSDGTGQQGDSMEQIQALFEQLSDDTLLGIQSYLRSTTLKHIVDIAALLLDADEDGGKDANTVVQPFLAEAAKRAELPTPLDVGRLTSSATMKAMHGLSALTVFRSSFDANTVTTEDSSVIWHDTGGFARALVLPALTPHKDDAAAASWSPWRPNAKALAKTSDALMITLQADNEAAAAADAERSLALSQLEHTRGKLMKIAGHMMAAVRRATAFNRGVCSDHGALLRAFPAICALSPPHRAASAMVEANLLSSLASLLVMHRQSARAQLVGLRLCTELLRSAYILEDTQSRLTSHLIECQTQMLPIVLSAMHIHSEDAALQVAACEVMMEFAKSRRNFPHVLTGMADKAAVVLIRLLARSADERDVATHLILLLATLPGPPCAFMNYLNQYQHWPSVRAAFIQGHLNGKQRDANVTAEYATTHPDSVASMAWKREAVRRQRKSRR